MLPKGKQVEGDSAGTLWRKAGEGTRIFCAGLPGADLRQAADGWLMVTGEHLVDFNGGFIDAGPSSEALLKEYVGAMRSRGLSGFLLFTKAAEASLGTSARELGLVFGGPARLMSLNVSTVLDRTTSFQIEVVKGHSGIQTFTEIMAAAYGTPLPMVRRFVSDRSIGDPAILHLIARRHGEPYSVGTAVETGSSVGIWNMGTPPDKQRQGAGRAVLGYALWHYTAAGRHLFYLLASEEGRHLYEQVGFRLMEEGSTWLIDA